MVKGKDPPICNRCNSQITVNHVLVECRKYDAARRKYFSNPSLASMLKETDNFSIDRLILYLQEIDILNKIWDIVEYIYPLNHN